MGKWADMAMAEQAKESGVDVKPRLGDVKVASTPAAPAVETKQPEAMATESTKPEPQAATIASALKQQEAAAEDPAIEAAAAHGKWSKMAADVKASDEAANLDRQTGAPAADRAAASVKMTQAGKAGYYADKYGPENVRVRDGEIDIRPDPAGKWIQADEANPSLRDFADMAGGALEAAPAIGAGIVTANPLIAGAASGGGNVLRQAISGLIPGDDEMTLKDRAMSTGLSAGIGAAAQGGSNLVAKGIDKVRPSNIIANYLNPAEKSRIAAKGLALEADTGVEFSAAQLTGGRGALTLESLIRQHPATKDIVNKSDIGRLKQLRSYFSRTMEGVSEKKFGSQEAGDKAIDAYKKYVGKLAQTRRDVADKNFGEAIAVTGENKVIPITNYRAALDDVEKNISSFAESADTMAIKRYIGTLKKNADAMGGISDVRSFQNALADIGQNAGGYGKTVKGLETATKDKRVATIMHNALLKDLDSVIENGGVPGVAGEALLKARDSYRIMSQELDTVRENVLSKVIDAPGEKIVEKFVGKTWAPSQIRESVKLLREAAPESLNGLRREALESVLDKALPSGAKLQVGGVPIDPARLVTQANNYDDQIKALFTGDRPGYVAWRKGVAAAQRLADQAGMGGSQTAPLQWTMALARSYVGNVKTLNIAGLASDIATTLTPKRIAKAMLTKQGRDAILQLTKTGNTAKAAMAALAKIQSLDAEEPDEPKHQAQPQAQTQGGTP